jgi:Icc-related predicted phosphoesterase
VAKTTIFFATDVHGSEKCFFKFLNSAKHYRADHLILGGDLCGKVMVPVVALSGDRYEAQYLGERVEVDGAAALEQLLKQMRFGGYYPYVTDRDELAVLQSDTERRDEVFNGLVAATLERWVSVAEERLAGTGTKVFMMLGNDDEPELTACLEGSAVIQHAEGRILDIDGHHTVLSYGYSNRTPWNSPRELDEDELYRRVEELAVQVPQPERCVFNLHVPPIASGLDEAPMMDEELRPVASIGAGGVATGPAGSVATRQAIETYQPLLGLHGHIHESMAMSKIGRSSCFNPGSEYGVGILRGALLSLDTKKGLRNYMFTTG